MKPPVKKSEMKEAGFFETIEAVFPTGGYEKAQTNAISASHYEVQAGVKKEKAV